MAIRSSASLYVGDLHPDVSDSLLLDTFSRVGQVISARVCRDLQTRVSLGYGYVNFANPADADRAIETLNFSPLLDKAIRVSWSQRDPSQRKSGVGNVFIKNLKLDMDNKGLYDLFSRFGNIVSLKIMTNDTGASKGYAYVQFDTAEAADKAIAEGSSLKGDGIDGQLVVAPFQRRSDRVGSQFTNIYFKNFDKDIVTEKELRELLGSFGEITSLYVPAEVDGKLKGFGFCNFKDATAARNAIEALHDKEHHGRKLYAQRAQSRKEREILLRQQREQRRQDRQRRFYGLNLYVRNLDETIDDAQLSQAFSTLGTITSAKVMRDDKNMSRGFGFVCFSNQEDAQRALTEMHNKMLGSKPLYVSLHQPREQRRQYLEQLRSRSAPMPSRMPFQPGMYQPMYFGPVPGRPGMPPAGQFAPGYAAMGRPGPMWRGQPPQAGTGPRPPIQGQGFPAMGGFPGGAPRGARTTGPRGPRPQGVPQPAAGGAPAGAAASRQQIQFKSSARNVHGATGASEQSGMQTSAATQAPTGVAASEQLTAVSLAALDPQMQKQVLGERLYPLVNQLEPGLSAKITGMLLQMDNSEILHLLESREALVESIREAVEVLQSAGYGAEAGADAQTTSA